MRGLVIWLSLGLSWGVLCARATALEVPEFYGPVMDLAGILPLKDRPTISNLLKQYEARTGHQFAFLSVPSLEGQVLEEYSLAVAEHWKLGRPGVDDGLLMLVAKKERKCASKWATGWREA